MSGHISTLLLLPHIRVHNANALSSPYTIGFPAMTAWLGATHALQRKLHADGWAVHCEATGVVCHEMNLNTYRGPGDFVASIVGTGNPLVPKSEKSNPSNAVRASFIEEARCHLDVSLVVQLSDHDSDDSDALCKRVSHHLNASMKMAGGDILQFNPPEIMVYEEGNQQDIRALNRRLMPGYAIIERRELMQEAMAQGQDALDALVDYLSVYNHCTLNDDGSVTWSRQKKTPPVTEDDFPTPAGWLVPLATGFQGISPLGNALNQRDPQALHRFAESVVTLGQFIMPYRLNSLDELLWRYHYDESNNLYLCVNNHQDTENDTIYY